MSVTAVIFSTEQEKEQRSRLEFETNTATSVGGIGSDFDNSEFLVNLVAF